MNHILSSFLIFNVPGLATSRRRRDTAYYTNHGLYQNGVDTPYSNQIGEYYHRLSEGAIYHGESSLYDKKPKSEPFPVADVGSLFSKLFATDRQTGNDGVDIVIQLSIGFAVVLAGAFFAAVIVNAGNCWSLLW